MGPDCGTAIINGVPVGFANAVRRGRIGVIAASGTGAQEVTSLIHELGSGISQAFGTGGRDLSSAVKGRMALRVESAVG
jgi:FdrA protein